MGNPILQRLKSVLGCWAHERWKTEQVLSSWFSASTAPHWTDLCNRIEYLEQGSSENARACCWNDASFLTVCRLFPDVGGRLLRHVSKEYPFSPGAAAPSGQPSQTPAVSVILPVGGKERIPLVQAVIGAFQAQTTEHLEVIVVENGLESIYRGICPEGVRYLFVPMDRSGEFNKSRLMNEGANIATAPILLFHDADIIPPKNYVETIVRTMDEGWDAIRPIRFLFCLDREATRRSLSDGNFIASDVALVMQNFPGASTAVRIEAYWRIGGHDEQFCGWGGEDTEFLQRLKKTRLFQGGFMPGIHLWHESGPKKSSGDKNNLLLSSLSTQTLENRVVRLQEIVRTRYPNACSPLES